MRVVAASENRRVRWKNDGGWTTEIARDPLDGERFRWRISIAEIERDGPFSSFPGIDRDLLLLDGSGIELDIDDAPPRRLAQRFERVHFPGESRVDRRLLAGPTRDFNVMADRALVRAEVFARPLVGFETFAKDELIATDGDRRIVSPCDGCTIFMPTREPIVGREAVYLTRAI